MMKTSPPNVTNCKMAGWNQRSNLAYDSIGGGLNYERLA